VVATNDFSGLTSWAWALASAAAMVPILSLERCMAALQLLEIKADGTRFGTLGPDAMASRFLGILRHQRFQLDLRTLMLQKGLSGAAEDSGKFRPGIRGAHVDDPHRFDAWLGRFNTKQSRGLAALDTAPELPLGGDNEVLIKRISMGSNFDPFAAAGDHREHRAPCCNHPHIVLQLWQVFFGRGLFRE